RLAVDEELRSGWTGVGHIGTVAAPLLPHHEQHADACLSRLAEPLDRSHLRGENSLRVARAAAVQAAVANRAREMRGHTVVVRGEDNDRRIERGDDISPTVGDWLLVDAVAERAKAAGQPLAG